MIHQLTWATLIAIAATKGIIGVSPENQHLYQPNSNGKWACLSDPSIELNLEQINDDICDCPDGSDEPGTAACSSIRSKEGFYCSNEGYFPGYIQNFKVNDGVCDYEVCCDGSDEWATGKCPNKCDVVKKQFDEYVAETRAELGRGLRTREEFVKKAERAKSVVAQKLEKIQEEIAAIEAQIKNENDKLSRAKNVAESDSNEESYTKELSDLTSQLSDYIKNSVTSEEKSKSTISKLEGLLNDLVEKYNSNDDGSSVKQCINQFKEYLTGKQEEEKRSEFSIDSFVEKIKGLKPSNLLPNQNIISVEPTFDNMLHHYYSKFLNTFKPKSEEEEVKQDKPKANVSNRQIVAIEKTIAKLEKDLHSKKSEASIYEDNVQKQFGKDDIFRAVEGDWVSRQIGEYNYKIGYLDSIYQDNTLVGRLTGIKGSTLHFEHGVKCWNGPHRSAYVDLVCSADTRLVSVTEPEKCQYRFLLETPIACEAKSDDEIAKEFKVDPSNL
ncbi:hypothetical protein FT663_03851 [Candidozyma haemuli var. vulneris]|uniref:Glucosidase 2 subunit beta n=1 Tax=Candidozyma haemuli TaxID=45357 RepID=A0A2V1AZH8_9ASCO|nr:hypothetical protein CXQ85_002641 [[Candida] haemuloni]KAF3988763.1 hypothetical protein FT662_03213 [[Candida] haemuloni var. vulneris]KAF3988878.1 hypothetical protein FT663_03851 [[Candida] haemuloni var. vulneris]PVH22916.1 hypothetical protein CXQ85_002641 [[Candida] haemuloni]